MRSLSGAMPFSRASAPMASRISRDMCLLLDEVGAGDVAVGDGDDPGRGGDRHLGIRGADQLAGEGTVAVPGVARTHARAPSQVAAEVVGLREGAVPARAGDLERVLLAHLGQELRDALAEVERDPAGMVDEDADRVADELDEQHLDVGRTVAETRLDIDLDLLHVFSFWPNKKAGYARFRYDHRPTADRCGSCRGRIAPGPTLDGVPHAAVQQVIRDAGGRELAPGEWGLTVPDVGATGWALDVGLRLSRGVLR